MLKARRFGDGRFHLAHARTAFSTSTQMLAPVPRDFAIRGEEQFPIGEMRIFIQHRASPFVGAPEARE